MKILDRYILTSYLKTFISVFVILMLIFVLQAIWLYIKELAGKDLDLVTILKFLMYITPTLIPLILPLTILLSSIMVFGNFAENYEFAAMKSTGISLQRAMSGLGVFIVILSITTFFFSNNVIPWAHYESHNLRKNIAKLKPAMAIAEGQFNDIGENFNIKVEEKSGENGKFLKGVTIHKKSAKRLSGNHTVIVAKTGELASAEDSNILKLILFDGYYYDDTPPRELKERQKKPFVKSEFKKHIMNIDLTELNNVDLEEKNVDNKYTMLNISELNQTLDSLKQGRQEDVELFSQSIYNRTNLATLDISISPKKDSIYDGKILDLFDTRFKVQLLDYAVNNVSSTMQILKSKQKTLKNSSSWINKHGIELHKKFALAVACIILFFVGAPLGALIRKGGLGLPMVIAIILFLTYHFIGLFAENSAKNGKLNPALSAWFSTLIMLPLSIFLTKRATEDRGLFEFDHITVPIKNWYNNKFGNKNLVGTASEEKNSQIDTVEQESISKIEIDSSSLNNYKTLSTISIITYMLALILFILYFVFKNNKLPQLANAGIQLSAISYLVFLFNYIKLFSPVKNIFNQLNIKDSLLSKFIGFIIYPITHISRNLKVKTYR
ncbi:Lipopolysaccharide export system permease protein LptF [Mesoflavibacter sp. HG96]|uniref:LptF/LptG family permease n=1 Tax=Mesoflavibacter profundi TaxID=2708110 RepID=A0ABT4RYC5_9FLAO|nr:MULTISPECIES: LptF/LptG family permease [Mesoflavibacter]MDA0176813.1 LptF/LptG family permease [Mesoflavibacter profundi]QIJ90471.1 Lipopolysaccharide export system permease protein LptF [Mesoflavibacter sp. HG96]QIJ93199.1 Lipopolysaccharide export system permease protein LptF [Mesoflavibacter sp. HG37]